MKLIYHNNYYYKSQQEQRFYILDTGQWKAGKFCANDLSEDQETELPDINIHDTAFSYLKLIQVDLTSNDKVSITWDNKNTTSLAMTSLLDYLKKELNSFKSFSFYFLDGGWCKEIHTNPHNAIRRIIEIQSHKNKGSDNGIFFENHPIIDTPDSYFNNSSNPIRIALDAWKQGKFETGPSSRTGNHFIDDYLQRYTYENENDCKFNVSYLGTKSYISSLMGEEWRRKAINKPLDDNIIDDLYSHSTTKSYVESLNNDQPIYQHVRALVRFDHREDQWLNYERLILPNRNKSGTPMVSVIAYPRTDISIPMYRRTQSLNS